MDGANKIKVKRSGLSEFLIKVRSRGGEFAGGEVTSVHSNETQNFSDVNDIIRIIERHCDAVNYPQAQRKLRGWDA